MTIIPKKCLKNEAGISLVEVLVTLVIVSIISAISVSMLKQSDDTTTSTKDIVDETYIAQTELSSISVHALKTVYIENTALSELGYSYDLKGNYFYKTVDNAYIKVTFKNAGINKYYTTTIEVSDIKDGPIQSQAKGDIMWK